MNKQKTFILSFLSSQNIFFLTGFLLFLFLMLGDVESKILNWYKVSLQAVQCTLYNYFVYNGEKLQRKTTFSNSSSQVEVEK